MAASVDGRVANPDGSPRRLSSPEDLERVHALRAEVDAVLVGVGTVVADDPRLTARTAPPPGKQPLRVVLDSTGRTPEGARVVDESAPSLVIVAQEGLGPIGDADVVQAGVGRVDVEVAVGMLADRGVSRLLVEGGPTVVRSFMAAGLVDTFQLYTAPASIGAGPSIQAAFDGLEVELALESVRQVGDGSLASYEVLG